MQGHRWFFGGFVGALALLAALLWSGARQTARHEAGELPALRRLVSALSLTDLALWTEARYTRHPSQADFFSPFQDAPGALERFPAGSVMAPSPATRVHR